MPIVQALALSVPKAQRKYVDLLRDSLDEVVSPFVNRLADRYHKLTPTEIRICHLIRSGLRTKEIAELQGVSAATVNRHREHIRSKLEIKNTDVNLVTYLQSTMDEPPRETGRAAARQATG
jgi:DNA-binding CsgD family transcriptional regulator